MVAYVMSCAEDVSQAIAAAQAGETDSVKLAAVATGFDDWARTTGDAVNQWNQDTATILSNAPASERLPAAFRVGVTGTLIAGSLVGPRGVPTPYGIARQEFTSEALSARSTVENGATLYKAGTLGPSNAAESQFWSLKNPLSTPNYANSYGIPPGNVSSGNSFLLTGQLREGASFVTRSAPGFGSSTGGALEVVVEEFGVMITSFIMP